MDGIKQNPDGSVDVTLRKPLTIDGASVNTLRMREPLVEDQLAAQEASGGDNAKMELTLMANLCMLAPADLKKLTMRDYKKVQAAFAAFLD